MENIKVFNLWLRWPNISVIFLCLFVYIDVFLKFLQKIFNRNFLKVQSFLFSRSKPVSKPALPQRERKSTPTPKVGRVRGFAQPMQATTETFADKVPSVLIICWDKELDTAKGKHTKDKSNQQAPAHTAGPASSGLPGDPLQLALPHEDKSGRLFPLKKKHFHLPS